MAEDHKPPSYDQVMKATFEGYAKTEDTTVYNSVYYEPTTSWPGNTGGYSYVQQNQTIPNNNQWSGSEVCFRPLYNNPDDEVSYISESNAGITLNYQDDSRCSSTDTTFSSSSQLTVFSQSSNNELYNLREDIFESQTDRKRKLTENETKQSKKHRNSPVTQYKRWPKPPYSYNGIIATVIWNSKKKALNLNGILTGMMELFPFFRGSYTGWRDSVRNNLSKTPCFVRTQINLWTLDTTKLTAGMFLRQENRIADFGDYKATIHEHLNLPPIKIPDCGYKKKQRKKNAHSKEKYKLSTLVPNSNHKGTDTDSINQLNVSLPRVDDCFSQAESPFSTYAYKRREFSYIEDVTVPKMDSISDVQKYTSVISNKTNCHYPASLYDVRKFVEAEPRSSLDAIEHLSSLCFSVPNKETSGAPVSETPQIPPYRDNDAQLPQSLKTQLSPGSCVSDSCTRNSDCSISGLISPSTVSESVSYRTVDESCIADPQVFETL